VAEILFQRVQVRMTSIGWKRRSTGIVIIFEIEDRIYSTWISMEIFSNNSQVEPTPGQWERQRCSQLHHQTFCTITQSSSAWQPSQHAV